jgi:hypothetical protein
MLTTANTTSSLHVQFAQRRDKGVLRVRGVGGDLQEVTLKMVGMHGGEGREPAEAEIRRVHGQGVE